MKNKTKQNLRDILSNGENRPLFVPNPIGRMEYNIRVLTERADTLERIGKANPDYYQTLGLYRIVQDLREQVLGLADTALLISEFYQLKSDKWMEFNAEYIGESNG